MVMVTGDEPVHGVHLLRNKLTHAKYGSRHQSVELRDVYGAVGYHPLDHQRIAGLVSSGAIFREVPFGEVKVDFDALQENGYGGIWPSIGKWGMRPRGYRVCSSIIRQYR
ncbi:hypothetical protein BSK64_27430 [Paenibacillus odorifer]|nr:hypothetical protein BSK64_27430 [Paenibacillus odorifer]